jgi:hypothetical protein
MTTLTKKGFKTALEAMVAGILPASLLIFFKFIN